MSSESSEPVAASTNPAEAAGFYWQTARDSLFTETAIHLFQLAVNHDGEDFDSAKLKIDNEYESLRGNPSARHGGKFQTAVQVYQEAGWLFLEDGKLKVTDAGRQALGLYVAAPSFLKAIPYFIIELLSRYQFNNPARPPSRNDDLAQLRATSDIFPYWTIWKIMRECGNKVTTEELRRFVFRLHRSEDVAATIDAIKAFRSDLEAGLTKEQLDAKYPARLEGASGEPKYWMARAGANIGTHPPLIIKPDPSTFTLSDYYLSLIDSVLANAPIYQESLTDETWAQHYGSAVDLAPESIPAPSPDEPSINLEGLLDQEDPLAKEVSALIDSGSRSLLLTGPPGTSKSWYARQLARRIVDGDMGQVRLVQFHPSYGYEDFIEGFVPHLSEAGIPTFVRSWKVFAEACQLASGGKFAVLVIDEFSRGDAGRIFGEALTYIEPDYRETPFRLASGRRLTVPDNLIIIGTMNPFDRSVSAVDVALQRRFEVLRLPPSAAILEAILSQKGMEKDLIQRVLGFFSICQDVMPHGGLGHAYFLDAVDIASLKRIWRFRLAPLFEQELRFEPLSYQKIESAYHSLIGG